jgi:hypothetical protein
VTSYTSPEMEIHRSSADACARSSLEEITRTSPAASSGGDIASAEGGLGPAVGRDVGVGEATGIGGREGGDRILWWKVVRQRGAYPSQTFVAGLFVFSFLEVCE